nr:hypothetical transcript [Hymenolepis microstoma]
MNIRIASHPTINGPSEQSTLSPIPTKCVLHKTNSWKRIIHTQKLALRYFMDPLPSARIVHLNKWPNTNGYGFVLKDSKSNEYRIGNVEEGLPADSVGIMENDIVIEVNGRSINDMRYSDVVNIIRQYPNKVSLMLLQPYEKHILMRRGVKISSSTCPVRVIKGRKNRDDTTAMICQKLSADTVSKTLINCDAATAANLSKARIDHLSPLIPTRNK